ncbi:LysM peptidoglycan-binding domain-containing protein [Thermodesulfobacteriota bacterium]
MEKEYDKDMEGFVEDIAEEYGYNSGNPNGQLNHTPTKGTLAIWGAAILIISFFITIFFGNRSEVTKEDLTALNARIEEIDVKLSALEKNGTRLDNLYSRSESLKQTVASIERSMESVKKQVAGLSAKAAVRQTKSKGKTKAVKTPSTKKGKGLYHTVKKGETLFGIADKYDLTINEIRSINKLKGDTLKVGQKLLVVPVKQ